MWEITNFFSGNIGHLEKLEVSLGKADLQEIVRICDHPIVYDVLFQNLFSGKRYEIEDAVKFAKWANDGWKNTKWFVFLVRDEKGKIVGCIDIKNLPPSGEIGYWADPDKRGWMTNVVAKLKVIAQKMGYERLFAHLVKEDNIKSSNLLIRSGFIKTGWEEKEGKKYINFEFDC